MHFAQQRILNKFKQEPLREIPTTELVRAAHKETYPCTRDEFSNPDRKTLNTTRRLKGQLHRKTLYHLNKLVKEGILRVSSTKEQGEKQFSLAIDHGEIIVNKYHRKITITKNSISTNHTDEYEKTGILHKFDHENWINKLNCILIECQKDSDSNESYNKISRILPEINDCIGINNFEYTIEQSPESAQNFLSKLEWDAKDRDINANLIINLTQIKNAGKVIKFIETYSQTKPESVTIIFQGDTKSIKNNAELLAKTAELFMNLEIKLNFQNTTLNAAPILIGKAGVYSLNDTDWTYYKKNSTKQTFGLAYANVSLAIDMNRFYHENLGNSDFRDLVLRASKTLLKMSSVQMKHANESFRKLVALTGQENSIPFFCHQKSHLRFWNYDFKDKKQENFPDLLESCKAEIETFCSSQRKIYNACGLPTNFDIVFSSTLNKFSNGLSQRNYTKATIRSFKDYQEEETSKFINNKERLSKIMLGGDRSRFFRKGDFTADSFTRELGFLTSTYELPFITYDFKETLHEMKLTNFIEG